MDIKTENTENYRRMSITGSKNDKYIIVYNTNLHVVTIAYENQEYHGCGMTLSEFDTDILRELLRDKKSKNRKLKKLVTMIERERNIILDYSSDLEQYRYYHNGELSMLTKIENAIKHLIENE
jgi:hypothetical protein